MTHDSFDPKYYFRIKARSEDSDFSKVLFYGKERIRFLWHSIRESIKIKISQNVGLKNLNAIQKTESSERASNNVRTSGAQCIQNNDDRKLLSLLNILKAYFSMKPAKKIFRLLGEKIKFELALQPTEPSTASTAKIQILFSRQGV